MAIRILLVIAFVLSLSCASDAPLHFRFDSDVSEMEHRAATGAMATWNPNLLDDHQLVEDADGPWRITLTDDDSVLPSDLNGRTCGRHADPDNDCKFDHWIRVRRGSDEATTRRYLMHEMGHAMRLEHVGGNGWGDQHSIMTEWAAADAPSAADLEEGRRAGACPMITIRTLPPAAPASE